MDISPPPFHPCQKNQFHGRFVLGIQFLGQVHTNEFITIGYGTTGFLQHPPILSPHICNVQYHK